MIMKRRSVLMAGLAGAALAGCGPRRSPPLNAVEGRLADWAREILADSPELASQAGVSEEIVGAPFSSRLDDRSSLAVEARRSAAIRRLAELRSLDRSGLSAGDALNLTVLDEQFANAASAADFEYGDFSPLGGVAPYVLNQLDSAFIDLPSFLDERHPIASDADAEAYLQRLRAVADAIDQETARMGADAALSVRPPGFIMDQTYALLQDVLSQSAQAQPYFVDLSRKLSARAADETDPGRKAQMERRHLSYLARAEAILREHVLPAHQRAASVLRAQRPAASEDPGVRRLPNGTDFYAAALKIETTTDLAPAEIHAVGLERVADLTRELDVALRRLGLTEGAVGARLAQMTADPRHRYPDSDEGRAELMADVRRRIDAVQQRAPQWFGALPRAALDIRRVPALAEASAPGAYYSPPSLDGATPGIYYLNLRNLGELTRIDLPTQDFHEAVPGHHFQIALAQERANAPLLNRLLSFNAYSEGWALYAEQLADEVGLLDGDGVGRVGYLRWQLWRAARLVVDTGLHALDWPRQQAIDYLLSVTGDVRGVVETEVDRYVVWPGQACGYELGRREIARLREHARNQLGADFDLRAFHDTVLLSGELPMTVLGQVVSRWIPEQRERSERERGRR
jgi:uncharacterized protein (DUF885 family)